MLDTFFSLGAVCRARSRKTKETLGRAVTSSLNSGALESSGTCWWMVRKAVVAKMLFLIRLFVIEEELSIVRVRAVLRRLREVIEAGSIAAIKNLSSSALLLVPKNRM